MTTGSKIERPRPFEAPATAERLNRPPRASACVVGFAPALKSARQGFIRHDLGVLLAAMGPGVELDLAFRPSGGGPVAPVISLVSERPCGDAGQLLTQFIGLALPGARLEGAAAPRPAPGWRRIACSSLDLDGPASDAGSPAPAIIPGSTLRDARVAPSPRVADVTARRMDLDGALMALSVAGSDRLRIRIALVALDASMLRALSDVGRSLAVRDLRDGPDDRLDAVRAYAGRMGREQRALRVEAWLADAVPNGGLADEPYDDFTLDAVGLALFGGTIDREAGDAGGVDLRDLWPLDLELACLLPSPDAAAPSSVTPASSGSRPDERVLGRGPGGLPVVLAARDRDRHLYVVGGTGTGKSTLLLNMLAQDFRAGEGVILFDPHGDLADEARDLVPAARAGDLIFADAARPDGGFVLDVLGGHGTEEAWRRSYAANALIRLFSRVLYEGVPEAFGPMFELYFRNALLLLMEAEGPKASLAGFESIFLNGAHRERLLARCHDPKVREFWTDLAVRVTHDEISLNNIAPYVTCKLAQFTGNPVMRGILCAEGGQGLDLRRIMDEGRILILKAPGGLIGRSEAEFLGAVVCLQLAQAGMSRAALPRAARRPCRVYLDEFQICAGDGIAELLAESRKYGLSLVLANQSLGQIDGAGRRPDVAQAALANAANLIALRVGATDAARLAAWFAPEVAWSELCRQPDFHAVARLLEGGVPHEPQRIRLAPPPQGETR